MSELKADEPFLETPAEDRQCGAFLAAHGFVCERSMTPGLVLVFKHGTTGQGRTFSSAYLCWFNFFHGRPINAPSPRASSFASETVVTIVSHGEDQVQDQNHHHADRAR